METVITSKQVAGSKGQSQTQTTNPWHIVIDMKYTKREAAIIQAFIAALLDDSNKEVTDGQTD